MTSAPDREGARHVDVSVLIPVLNEAQYLPEVTRRMLAQRFGGEVEYIFIDGGSDDGSRAFLEELAARDRRVVVLDNPARRTPNALNIGLRHARGEMVARMDAHSHYPPDYLAIGAARLRHGDVAHVSGPQLAVGSGGLSRRVALALGMRFGTGGADFRHQSDREFEVDSGFVGVWERETLQQYGGWDEGWPVDQDFELAARLRADGRRFICVPAMAASYIPRSTLRSLARQYWNYGQYRTKTARRHPGSMRPSHLLPPTLALTATASLVPARRVRRPALAGLAVWLAAALSTGVKARRTGAPAGDAASLPLVFATMHFSYGFGFLAGCARFGPPVRAVAALLRRR